MFHLYQQFIIDRDGNFGLNYEHSVAEGIAVIRLLEHILDYMNEIKRWKLTRYASICDRNMATRLEWNLDEISLEAIQMGLDHTIKVAQDLSLEIVRFCDYGREFPKTVNMSPDSWIQLALQLSHFKTHGYLVHTYESASVRRFHLGRVDNIRSSSIPALEWVKSMVDSQKTNDERIVLLRKAMDWQTEVMLENILGYGVDNHLLGLRQTALESGEPMPAIFQDSTYVESNLFRLSTSQVPTTSDSVMCYGAVVPDGYGAAYNPHKDFIVIVVSSWFSCPETNSAKFAKNLKESLIFMRDLVLTNPELAKQKANEPFEWKIPEIEESAN